MLSLELLLSERTEQSGAMFSSLVEESVLRFAICLQFSVIFNLFGSSMRPEGETDGADQQGIRDHVVPANGLFKDQKYKHRKDDQGDAFLHDLELGHAEVV